MKRQNAAKKKALPYFSSEKAERKFWAKHDSAVYVDWAKAARNPSFPELRPSTRTVSLRLSESLLNDIKRLAHRQDVPYQSLIKIILAEKIREAAA